MVQSRHAVVPRCALPEVRRADPVCSRSQRRGKPASTSRKAVAYLCRMPASRRLQYSDSFTFSEARTRSKQNRESLMKAKKVEPDFRIWCEQCSIRIAPHEMKIVAHGKTYHQRCHSKLDQTALVAAASPQATDNRRGGK